MNGCKASFQLSSTRPFERFTLRCCFFGPVSGGYGVPCTPGATDGRGRGTGPPLELYLIGAGGEPDDKLGFSNREASPCSSFT